MPAPPPASTRPVHHGEREINCKQAGPSYSLYGEDGCLYLLSWLIFGRGMGDLLD